MPIITLPDTVLKLKWGKNKMGVRNPKEMTSSTTEKDRDDHRQPLGLPMPQGSHIYFRSKIQEYA